MMLLLVAFSLMPYTIRVIYSYGTILGKLRVDGSLHLYSCSVEASLEVFLSI